MISTEGRSDESSCLSPPTEIDPEKVEAVALLLLVLLLALALVMGRTLERWNSQLLGSAGSALLLGLVLSIIFSWGGLAGAYQAAIAFKYDTFIFILLPIIMFEAGYSLDSTYFLSNLFPLALFSFVGTTVSTFVVGVMMWAFGVWGWCERLSLISNLTFGAIISATDPVTVLAVFNKLNADPQLYALVFGESVMNDAVASVLYHTISGFIKDTEVNSGTVLAGVGIFFGVFSGSMALGCAMGGLGALLLKTQFLFGDLVCEAGMILAVGYSSYLAADAAGLSGIVAIIFCAMTLSEFGKPNLSASSREGVHSLLRVAGGLAELFVFVYIGLALFLGQEAFNIWSYTALCLLALAASRAANILPCAAFTNAVVGDPAARISAAKQLVMWWSGLRGAMAFALAVQAAAEFGHDGMVMKTCTYYLVTLTVLVNGGSAGWLLNKLSLRSDSAFVVDVLDLDNGTGTGATNWALHSDSQGVTAAPPPLSRRVHTFLHRLLVVQPAADSPPGRCHTSDTSDGGHPPHLASHRELSAAHQRPTRMQQHRQHPNGTGAAVHGELNGQLRLDPATARDSPSNPDTGHQRGGLTAHGSAHSHASILRPAALSAHHSLNLDLEQSGGQRGGCGGGGGGLRVGSCSSLTELSKSSSDQLLAPHRVSSCASDEDGKSASSPNSRRRT
ncbi:MAG: hypothetical protein WDW36_009833 [Sanguina aurantia]